MRRTSVLSTVMISCIGIFYLMTIREGHNWGGDFSLYIQHAKNIIEGIDYRHSGFIPNPNEIMLSPKTYPPLFPLLLAPIYKLFGIDITIMKIEIIVFFILSLFVIYRCFNDFVQDRYSIAIVMLMSFNPYFWEFKDNIIPDSLFLLITFLAMNFIHGRLTKNKWSTHVVLAGTGCGFLLYLSYSARSVGLLLLISLIVFDLIKNNGLSRFSCFAAGTFALFYLLQRLFFHSDSSYFDQLLVNIGDYPGIIFENIRLYKQSFSFFWDNGYYPAFTKILFFVMSGLSLSGFVLTKWDSASISHERGYVYRIRANMTIYDVFFVLYLGFILCWPANEKMRYLIPIIPIYLYYIIACFQWGAGRRDEKGLNVLFIAVMFVILSSYTGKYVYDHDFFPTRPIVEGVKKTETIKFFEYIRNHTKDSDIIVFKKPRVLALYTGRRSSIYSDYNNDRKFWSYISKIEAKYLVWNKYLNKGDRLLQFVKNNKDNFKTVYVNPDFKVYRIKTLRTMGL